MYKKAYFNGFDGAIMSSIFLWQGDSIPSLKKELKTKFQLGVNIAMRYCKNCLFPDTKPDLYFMGREFVMPVVQLKQSGMQKRCLTGKSAERNLTIF